MPITPAKRHFQKTSAGQNAEGDFPVHSEEQLNQYELMLLMLTEHKRKLKEIQSHEFKAVFKKEVLPEYEAYISGVIESDCGVQDDVLMTLMVWHIDTGDLISALEIGEYAIKHNLKTPEQYKRDTATLLAEELSEYSLRHTEAVDLDSLVKVETLTREKDMPDEVRAKIHKALGIKLAETSASTDALNHLKRALELNERSGVKKMIEKIERETKNAQSS